MKPHPALFILLLLAGCSVSTPMEVSRSLDTAQPMTAHLGSLLVTYEPSHYLEYVASATIEEGLEKVAAVLLPEIEELLTRYGLELRFDAARANRVLPSGGRGFFDALAQQYYDPRGARRDLLELEIQQLASIAKGLATAEDEAWLTVRLEFSGDSWGGQLLQEADLSVYVFTRGGRTLLRGHGYGERFVGSFRSIPVDTQNLIDAMRLATRRLRTVEVELIE